MSFVAVKTSLIWAGLVWKEQHYLDLAVSVASLVLRSVFLCEKISDAFFTETTTLLPVGRRHEAGLAPGTHIPYVIQCK